MVPRLNARPHGSCKRKGLTGGGVLFPTTPRIKVYHCSDTCLFLFCERGIPAQPLEDLLLVALFFRDFVQSVELVVCVHRCTQSCRFDPSPTGRGRRGI